MTQKTAHRGSGRRKMSVASELNKQQRQLGLGKSNQCFPSLERNTGIEPDKIPSLKAAVFMRLQQINFQQFISEEMATQAKATADLVEKQGMGMLYGNKFSKTAWAIAVLSFQKGGYTAYGLHFESRLNNAAAS
jgi:hypothetical protein